MQEEHSRLTQQHEQKHGGVKIWQGQRITKSPVWLESSIYGKRELQRMLKTQVGGHVPNLFSSKKRNKIQITLSGIQSPSLLRSYFSKLIGHFSCTWHSRHVELLAVAGIHEFFTLVSLYLLFPFLTSLSD